MGEFHAQFMFLVNLIWQRRFQALAVAWLVCLAGWATIASIPNVYQSSARLFVDTSNVLRPLLKGIAVESDIDAELEFMKQTLTSRSNMAAVARMTDLDLTAPTPSGMERLIDSLQSRTQIRSDGSKLITITFADTEPVRARDVVQALITTFMETNLGHSRQNIDAARQFLDRQLDDYQSQLERAEQRLADFKQKKLGKMPSRVDAQIRLDELRNQLADAEAEIRRGKARVSLLKQQLAAAGTTGFGQVWELERELTELLSRYTAQHPEVVAVRRKLDAARLGWPSEAGAQSATTPATAEAMNRASQEQEQLKAEVAQQEADIAFSADRANRLRKRIENLETQLLQVPELEAEMTKLNRDYEVIRLKYEELLSRREQARMSRERETRTEEIQFQVLDPPAVSNVPTGPSRALLIVLVLIAGLGAGAGFAIVLGLINETFADPAKLREEFALPVFGTISVIDSFREHSLRMAMSSAFIGCCLLLFTAFGGLLMVERQIGLVNLAPAKHVAQASQQVGATSQRLWGIVSDALREL